MAVIVRKRAHRTRSIEHSFSVSEQNPLRKCPVINALSIFLLELNPIDAVARRGKATVSRVITVHSRVPVEMTRAVEATQEGSRLENSMASGGIPPAQVASSLFFKFSRRGILFLSFWRKDKNRARFFLRLVKAVSVNYWTVLGRPWSQGGTAVQS